jgi:predicted ester cyclase
MGNATIRRRYVMTTSADKRVPEAYPAYQPIDPVVNVANKQRILAIMQQIVAAPLSELNNAIRAGYHDNASVNISHPINELRDLDALNTQFWQPLRDAFPDVERRVDIVAGGTYRDAEWVGCFGHYVGTFTHDWFGIPATGGVVAVRYNEGHRLQDGKIAESYIFVDFLDLMRQVGYWPIAPSLGREILWLPPMTHDGVVLTQQDNAVSQRTFDRIMHMWHGLDIHEGQLLRPEVMDMIEAEDARHFHPNFMWYGAAGIGTTRGIQGFDNYHGHPFVNAFPDRGGRDVPHFMLIADGRYAITGGWGYLQATHTGTGFLGMPPTGRHVVMRVMDFYRCDDETIRENWVPIDIPHLLMQMGVDIFGRMRHQFRQNNKVSIRSWLLQSS